MKKMQGDPAFVLGVINLLIVLIVAMVVKCFVNDVSIYSGGGFVAGFAAMIVEWCIYSKKSENAVFGALFGLLAGAVFAYFLGV